MILKSRNVFTDFCLLILFDSFKFSRCCFIFKSFTDGDESRNFIIDLLVNFPSAISPSKLPTIGFCLPNFEISFNTISYGFVFAKYFYTELNRFLTQALFNLPSVTCKSISSCKCCPILLEAKIYFLKLLLFLIVPINSR